MNLYPIHITSKITKNQLQQGLFLFLFRATRIPPHLGIIYKGKLFDITLNGPTVGQDAVIFYDTILNKYTKTVFIELNAPNTTKDVELIIKNKVLKYNCVTSTVSCLHPIKDVVSEVYGVDVSSTKFIFELLPILEKENILKNGYHIHLDRNISDSVFQLKTYTQQDIDRCMEALDRKETIC